MKRSQPSDFEALLKLVAKIPPQNEEMVEANDPIYKIARDERHATRGICGGFKTS